MRTINGYIVQVKLRRGSKNYLADEIFDVKGSQAYRREKVVYYLMKDKNKAKDLLVRQDAKSKEGIKTCWVVDR